MQTTEHSNIVVEPDDTARQIREFGRENPDLCHGDYNPQPGTVYALCYPLAEAYWHAKGGTDSDLEIYCLSWADVDPEADGTHWYLRNIERGVWVDLALEEPSDGVDVPYCEGRGPRAFMTGYETPSKRAKRVLEVLEL